MRVLFITMSMVLFSCSIQNNKNLKISKDSLYQSNLNYLLQLKKNGVRDYVIVYQSIGHSIEYSCLIWRDKEYSKMRLVKEGFISEDRAYLCSDNLMEYIELNLDKIQSDSTSVSGNSIPSLGYFYISFNIDNEELSYELTTSEVYNPVLYTREKVLLYYRIRSCMFGKALKDI